MIVKKKKNLENKMESQKNSLETRIERMQGRFNKDLEEIKKPGEGNGSPLQYFLPEKFHGQRSLVGYSPRGHKSRTRLCDEACKAT